MSNTSDESVVHAAGIAGGSGVFPAVTSDGSPVATAYAGGTDPPQELYGAAVAIHRRDGSIVAGIEAHGTIFELADGETVQFSNRPVDCGTLSTVRTAEFPAGIHVLDTPSGSVSLSMFAGLMVRAVRRIVSK